VRPDRTDPVSTLDWRGDLLFGIAFLAFGAFAIYAPRAVDDAPHWLRPLLHLYEGRRVLKVIFIVVGIAAIVLGVVRALLD
jgi:multisubunit Na+/H+ antiporter MnhB subunit